MISLCKFDDFQCDDSEITVELFAKMIGLFSLSLENIFATHSGTSAVTIHPIDHTKVLLRRMTHLSRNSHVEMGSFFCKNNISILK